MSLTHPSPTVDKSSVLPASTSSTQEIPAVRRAEAQQAAAQRRATFPFRFPHDQRSLGGKFSVAENARRLLRFFYLERRLAQALGAWTLGIPEFEVKVETGRHLFYHADAANALRQRLNEQEKTLAQIDAYRDTDIDRFIEEVVSAADAAELLVGVHQVAGAALATAYRHHADDTDPVTDARHDSRAAAGSAGLRTDARLGQRGGCRLRRGRDRREPLDSLALAPGAALGQHRRVDRKRPRCAAPEPLRSVERPFERQTRPQRDEVRHVRQHR